MKVASDLMQKKFFLHWCSEDLLEEKNNYRMQKMFLHQKCYKVQTLIIFFAVCETLKRNTSASDCNITLAHRQFLHRITLF